MFFRKNRAYDLWSAFYFGFTFCSIGKCNFVKQWIILLI